MMTVKIGANRQIIIPKKAFSALGLAAGDYLEVVVRDDTLVMVPKTLVDKDKSDARNGARRESDGNKSQTQQDRG